MSVTTVSLRTVALVDLLKVRCVRGKANRSNLIIELMQPTSQELWSLNLEALLNGVKRMIFLFCWNFSKMSFQTLQLDERPSCDGRSVCTGTAQASGSLARTCGSLSVTSRMKSRDLLSRISSIRILLPLQANRT